VVNRHRDSTTIAASLSVCAHGDGTVFYTMVLRNEGECALEATPETPIDTLSWEDLSLVAAAADRGTATVDLVANRISWGGTIPPGAAATITIIAAVQGGVMAGQQVSNQGSLMYFGNAGGPPLTVSTNVAAFTAGVACP
jgi:hypothetical protein